MLLYRELDLFRRSALSQYCRGLGMTSGAKYTKERTVIKDE